MHRVYSVYIPRSSFMYSIDEQKKWGYMFGYAVVTLHTKILQFDARWYQDLIRIMECH